MGPWGGQDTLTCVGNVSHFLQGCMWLAHARLHVASTCAHPGATLAFWLTIL
eukprot:NODE_6028_length_376_cov_2.409786_g5312_i0.p5 GENE.NODE_6028_length_376_cov_2.409786_g5312_i0~~NODE_6028_length_376_cov_2.409786_g5312_i0.p5  ORF type:complete len:52 (-),score=8.30 NODE_6028_length_376_cov_2.409786_g5312_i0:66-221(-)